LNAYQKLQTKEVTHHFNVHVLAPIALNQRLKFHKDNGRIVFIDSYSANAPRVGWSAYSIVKSAAQMAARSAAAELQGMRVVRIFPGAVRTALVESVLNANDKSPTSEIFKALNVAGTIVDPTEKSGVLVYRLSIRASNLLISIVHASELSELSSAGATFPINVLYR